MNTRYESTADPIDDCWKAVGRTHVYMILTIMRNPYNNNLAIAWDGTWTDSCGVSGRVQGYYDENFTGRSYYDVAREVMDIYRPEGGTTTIYDCHEINQNVQDTEIFAIDFATE